MIGTLPMKELAPLEYRYALDAAMSYLAGKEKPIIHCQLPQLQGEVEQRLPESNPRATSAALWIEPMALTWQAELKKISLTLSQDALLLIIASRPLARLLPERKAWQAEPLGVEPYGLHQLHQALRKTDFVLTEQHGFHSYQSIILNSLSQQATRWGYPALGDRLHFAARLRYCTTGRAASLSTVALLVARKKVIGCFTLPE